MTMKATELKELNVEELARKAAEMRENLFNLRIRHKSGSLTSSADLKKNKRDLARVMTVLTQKTHDAHKAPAAAAPAKA
jgi:large subunit ribosomal protein L29